jgi:hypothetical protein
VTQLRLVCWCTDFCKLTQSEASIHTREWQPWGTYHIGEPKGGAPPSEGGSSNCLQTTHPHVQKGENHAVAKSGLSAACSVLGRVEDLEASRGGDKTCRMAQNGNDLDITTPAIVPWINVDEEIQRALQ